MPPVMATRLPAAAMQATMSAIAIAHAMYAKGADGPSPAAAVPGRTKMPAPIVTLTRMAVSRRTPIARTSPASAGAGTSVETIKQSLRRHSNPSMISGHTACVLPTSQRASMANDALTDVYLDELSTLYDAEMQALRVLP